MHTGLTDALRHSQFSERFELLLSSRQVSQHTLETTQAILNGIARDFRLSLTEDNAGMFASHLALALERLTSGHSLEDAPSAVVAEAKTFETEWGYAWQLAVSLRADTGKQLPDGEIGYVTIHLRKLVEDAQSGAL